jgi:lipid II:glycine glycyltransferase (peptidoglycan interpeptide bridge formation enzyme)
MTDDRDLYVSVHRTLPDPEWDEFLQAAPNGTYQQSSAWAEVKATVGWRAMRLILYRQGAVTGGCQLLVRPLPVAGAVAYVPRGPVMAGRSELVLDLLLNALKRLARQERIVYLKLQPPPGGAELATSLERAGFVGSELEIAPRATTRIDLRGSTEMLLRSMRTNTRRNIAKARQRGVTVREGTEGDLRTFGALLRQTAERQGFSPYPAPYYERMYRAFARRGGVRMLIAEQEGVVLASNLVIGFDGTATYKMGAWSGMKKSVPPNELLHLAGIDWAREAGYRYYDLDDISLSAAEAVLRGERLDEGQTLERFKLGLGGEVLVFPGASDYSVSPLLGTALRRLAPHAKRFRPLLDRMLGRGVTGKLS